MTYDTQELRHWTTISDLTHTVWTSWSLWRAAARLWLCSAVVAITFVLSVRDPSAWGVGKFTAIAKFLNMFVGMMIGFFMAASVKRWWRTVNAFIYLCGTVRNLQMMLLACDAPDDEAKQTLRFGVMSAKLLSLEFFCACITISGTG